MNISGIISEIEKVDPEFQDRISPRRDVIKNMTGFGTKVAIAALPFALNSLLKKAYGQTLTPAVSAVLTFALKLEYFESAFYRTGLAHPTLSPLIPTSDRNNVLSLIAADEVKHVKFLQTAIGSGFFAQPADSSYDFTAKNNFANVFSNYATFLAVSQVLEDTGVRAYKGQAGALLGNQTYLTAALNIHSVEARHASALRYLRRTTSSSPVATTKPWITIGAAGATNLGNDTGISAVDGNYNGENATTQYNGAVDITKLPAVSGTTSATAAAESFDEPLTMAQVLLLVAPFNVS